MGPDVDNIGNGSELLPSKLGEINLTQSSRPHRSSSTVQAVQCKPHQNVSFTTILSHICRAKFMVASKT